MGWGRGEQKSPKLSFFKCRRIRLKLVIFYLFYDSPACDKKAEILLLATALIAHLRSQIKHVFTPLISVRRFKSIHFH